MTHPIAFYTDFPVYETFEVKDISDIRTAIDKMVQAYETLNKEGNFSYRILLPREENQISKIKKLGLTLQGEFLLSLRKRKLKPNIKEFRYIHDKVHYGWLLVNPDTYERVEKANKGLI